MLSTIARQFSEGVHSAEVEGMIGELSDISLLETGVGQAGHEQPNLVEKLRRPRLIVVPVANPDGRVRVPYDGWVGLPAAGPILGACSK